MQNAGCGHRNCREADGERTLLNPYLTADAERSAAVDRRCKQDMSPCSRVLDNRGAARHALLLLLCCCHRTLTELSMTSCAHQFCVRSEVSSRPVDSAIHCARLNCLHAGQCRVVSLANLLRRRPHALLRERKYVRDVTTERPVRP